MAIAPAKSWRPLVALTVAAIFACLATRAAAAEMAPAPSPSPASGDAGELDEETSLTRRVLDLTESDLDLSESEMVGLQKYMDRVEVRLGEGFRFETTVWELTPKELGFKLGVLFAQAAFQCSTVLNRASEDPSRPTPQIPAFVGQKLHLKLKKRPCHCLRGL